MWEMDWRVERESILAEMAAAQQAAQIVSKLTL
jgi:hypothetical protein